MGRTAHAPALPGLDDRRRMSAAEHNALASFLDEVQTLLDAPPGRGRRRGALSRVEHTLTSGYAHALGLEVERLRLERRLLAAAEAGDSGEVVALNRRMATADDELAHLRGLLTNLRSHVFDPRPADSSTL